MTEYGKTLRATATPIPGLTIWELPVHGDNRGLPFMVIDKTTAQVFVYGPEGQLRGETPALLGIAIMVALQLFVSLTKQGKAMRAVSEDKEASILMGINVNSTITLTFAIGSGLAAVAALMYCISYPQVSPMMGAMLGLKAFVAAVLGGIGSIPGAMVGGLLIGVAESLTKAYIGTITAGVITSAFSDAIVFGILIIVLLVKPSGLMGEPESEKV